MFVRSYLHQNQNKMHSIFKGRMYALATLFPNPNPSQ